MTGLNPPNHAQRVPGVMSNDKYKLFCDHSIQTDLVVRHNKPDLVLFDLPSKEVKIIEVAISWHTRLEHQKALKINRYTVNGNLEEEPQVEKKIDR